MKTITNPFRISELSLGKFLSFAFAAVLAAVSFNSSAMASASVSECSAPSAPQGVSISHGANYVSSWWSPPASDGGCAITSYQVTLQPDNITKTVTLPAILAESFLGFSPATTYTVIVVACNSAGCGTAASATLTAEGGQVPSEPQNLQVDRQPTYLTSWWNAPASEGSSPIMKYKVSLLEGETVLTTQETTERAFSFSAFWVPGGQFSTAANYTICVVAMNATGNGPAACATSPGLGSPPSAPLNLQSGSGSNWVSAWWSPPANDGGSPILSYDVTLTTTSGSQTHTVTLPAPLAEAFNTSFATSGSAATISVVAVSALGAGAPATISVTIP